VYRYFYETHAQLRHHLDAFIQAFNFAKRLKTLKRRSPYEFICDSWHKNPENFHTEPHHLTTEPNNYRLPLPPFACGRRAGRFRGSRIGSL